MKRKNIISFCAILSIIGLLSAYYLYTSKGCGVSSKICIESQRISIQIDIHKIGNNGVVTFGVGLTDNTGTRLTGTERDFHEQWNFGDETSQPIQEAHADGALPTYEASYEKKYRYTKPGTYTAYMQMLDAENEVLRKSNTITVTIPESSFTTAAETTTDATDSATQPEEQRGTLFYATNTKKQLLISTYNPDTQETPTTQTIPFEEQINQTGRNSSGGNDAVQFNPTTQEIFISTQGKSESAFENCINTDGTCTSRIYKITANSTTPTILYESENPPINWVVNPYDDSLLLSSTVEGKQILTKLNAQDGSVVFTQEYIIPKNTGLKNLVLSNDGKILYQASIESEDGKAINETLRLREFDTTTGELTEVEIFQFNSIDATTTISPNNKWIAFYVNAYEAPQLVIWEIKGKQPPSINPYPYTSKTTGEISNFNLSWSGDSKRLFYMRADGLVYFDTTTGTHSFVTTSKERRETPFVLEATGAESENYVFYVSSVDRTIVLYNTAIGKYITTPFSMVQDNESVNINGVAWY